MPNFTLQVDSPDSVESYISQIKSVLQLELRSKKYEYYYRGCSDYTWKDNLTPSVYRKKHIHKEHINFKEMILRSPNDFLNDTTTLEKLVKMQHYTLPTRLLDITSNPLVALYFACLTPFKRKKVNGKVYVFKISKNKIKYYDSDAVSLISNLAKLDINKTQFKEKNFGHLIYEIGRENPYFYDDDPRIENDIIEVFPVKVKLNNNRILKQSGAFLIFGMEDLTSKRKPALFPVRIIEHEIIIPEAYKKDILISLDSIAINENTLFPELEHQASYLYKH